MNFWKKALRIFLFTPLPLLGSLTFTHNVDVISGGLHINYEDHVVRGSMPISIRRSFFDRVRSDSSNRFEKLRDQLGLFCYTKLYVFRGLECTSGRTEVGLGQNTLYHVQIMEPGVGKLVM